MFILPRNLILAKASACWLVFSINVSDMKVYVILEHPSNILVYYSQQIGGLGQTRPSKSVTKHYKKKTINLRWQYETDKSSSHIRVKFVANSWQKRKFFSFCKTIFFDEWQFDSKSLMNPSQILMQRYKLFKFSISFYVEFLKRNFLWLNPSQIRMCVKRTHPVAKFVSIYANDILRWKIS